MCAAETRDFRQKAFTSSTSSSKIISQFKAQTLGDRVGSTGQKRTIRFGSRVKSSDPVLALLSIFVHI